MRTTGIEKEMDGVREVEKTKETVFFEIEKNSLTGLVQLLTKLDKTSILFSVSKRALRMFAVDSGLITMALGYINAESFRRYEISNEHAFSIENADLKSVLVLSEKDSIVSFTKVDEHIIMTSDGFSQEFDIEPEGKSVTVPGIEYNSGVLVNVKEFADVVSYADDVGSESVKLIKDGKRLSIQFMRGNTRLEKLIEISEVENDMPDGTNGLYPSEHLANILKGIVKMCRNKAPVMVRMKSPNNEVYPLKVSFREMINDNREIKGYVLIAPRTES